MSLDMWHLPLLLSLHKDDLTSVSAQSCVYGRSQWWNVSKHVIRLFTDKCHRSTCIDFHIHRLTINLHHNLYGLNRSAHTLTVKQVILITTSVQTGVSCWKWWRLLTTNILDSLNQMRFTILFRGKQFDCNLVKHTFSIWPLFLQKLETVLMCGQEFLSCCLPHRKHLSFKWLSKFCEADVGLCWRNLLTTFCPVEAVPQSMMHIFTYPCWD